MGSAYARSAWYVEPAGNSFDGNSERWAFKSDTLRKTGPVLASDVILGTRAARVESTRQGPYTVTGTLTTDWSPLFADAWLPRILGANESADAFATAETLPDFDILCDRVGGVFTYFGCKVARATWRGRQGGLIECALDIIGKTESTGASPPSVSLGTAAGNYPYQFADATVTIEGSARNVFDWELVVDNVLKGEAYNSLTAQHILEQGRIVTFTTNTEFTSSEMSALYGQDADSPAAVVLTMTRGSMSCVATGGRWSPTIQSPVVDGAVGEYKLPLSGVIRGIAGGADIAFTNDSTA